jgi:hypothetical protein
LKQHAWSTIRHTTVADRSGIVVAPLLATVFLGNVIKRERILRPRFLHSPICQVAPRALADRLMAQLAN